MSIAIIDTKIPTSAKNALKNYFNCIEFFTQNLTYDAIAGHPDIFFLQCSRGLITAPNTPPSFLTVLKYHDIMVESGCLPVLASYPNTAHYNAVLTNQLLIHNLKITDPFILKQYSHLRQIHVAQGYTRCSLLAITDDFFLTSDLGIAKILQKNFNVLWIDPSQILLNGLPHGFFGGAAAVFEQKLWLIGNLRYLKEGDEIRKHLHKRNIQIIELYDGPLYDGGSILMVS